MLRQQRRSLTTRQQHDAAILVARNLVESAAYKRCEHIAIYWPDDGEVATQEIIKLAWREQKNVYLPKISHSNQMDFMPYKPGDQLITSTLGIMSPAAIRKPMDPCTLDLIIAPLVAFDPQGNRLGRGGGYYDRFMQQRRKFDTATNPASESVFMGLTHSFQQVNSLPSAHWDVPLDAVLTEKKLTFFQH